MENVSILGCGTMGHSIALSAAWAGLPVKVYGISDQDLQIAKKGLQNKIKVMKDNGLFDEKEATRIMDLIKLSISLEEVVKETTFIIEVIPEVLELKKNMYKKLEALVDKDVIIASNTSGFMPSLLAEGMDHPNRFVVTHFWNPGHLIPLVEVVKGERQITVRFSELCKYYSI